MGNWIKANPAWFMSSVEAVVAALLNLILVFGFKLSGEMIAAINGMVIVVMVLALGLWAQQPIQRLVDQAESKGFN